MKVGINIDRSIEELEVLITAQEQSRTVNALYEHIVEFDKKSLETLTAYRDDIAKIVNVTDVFRIYTGNQKVYIQTHQGEYAIRYRLYELEAALDKKQFLRISNSEIVNVKKIRDIDLSIIGRICIATFTWLGLACGIAYLFSENVEFEPVKQGVGYVLSLTVGMLPLAWTGQWFKHIFIGIFSYIIIVAVVSLFLFMIGLVKLKCDVDEIKQAIGIGKEVNHEEI